MANDSTQRLYHLSSYQDDFFTGTCSDDRQLVMGLLCPFLAAYFFDSDGRLLGKETRIWNSPAPIQIGGSYDIYNDEFRISLDAQIREWQEPISYSPGRICISEFFDPDNSVGIEHLPRHYQEIASIRDVQEQVELIKSRDQWLREGCFVWWWAKDYYVSKNGEVDST